ncbi:UbiA prenyltransferase family-domain-containing protein [Halenospora varia]|nr:UbiA prenyltransferase family-domain-containing protein [Halenospora varia]
MSTFTLLRLPSACRSTFFRTGARRPQSELRATTVSLEIPRTIRASRIALFPPSSSRHFRTSGDKSNPVVAGHQGLEDLKPISDTDHLSKSLRPYEPPTKGLLSKLPSAWVPYAELIRLDKPTGTYYLYFPCLFSTLLAAPFAVPMASPLSVVGTSLLFFSGALIMRGAGCTINDLWDRNLDPHVARTRLRPIARGAITPFNALAFTGVQLFTGLGILLQFPYQCLFYGIPSLLFVASYPLAKRVTYYPQFVLGLTFSWGLLWAFLYTSNVAWTVLYDMIYAHMDIKDDAKAGIKSIALRHDKQTKQILSGLAVTQIGLLAAAGVAAGAGPVFFVGSCGGAAVTLAIMIKKVNLKSVKNCWWWFVNGCWITGGVISTGLGADYLVRYVHEEIKDKDV